MLKKSPLVALATIGILLGCCQGQAQERNSYSDKAEKSFSTSGNGNGNDKENSVEIDMKKLSETIGNFIGRNLKSPGPKFDLESLIQGIRSGAAGEPAPLTDKEYEAMMTAVQEKAIKEMSATNLKSANDFMAKNKSVQGVVEAVPGKLQYLVLKEGSGATVTDDSSPKINYTGKYQDGTVFGTSEEIGGPITIPLNQTIPGFSKGIVGMKEGEKRRIFVHPDLGYGTSSQLSPNELLIFDVEVVKANAEDDKSKAKIHTNAKDRDDDDQDNDDDDDDDLYMEEDDDNDSSDTKNSSSSNQRTRSFF